MSGTSRLVVRCESIHWHLSQELERADRFQFTGQHCLGRVFVVSTYACAGVHHTKNSIKSVATNDNSALLLCTCLQFEPLKDVYDDNSTQGYYDDAEDNSSIYSEGSNFNEDDPEDLKILLVDLHDLLFTGYLESKSLESFRDVRDLKDLIEEKKEIIIREMDSRINSAKASKADPSGKEPQHQASGNSLDFIPCQDDLDYHSEPNKERSIVLLSERIFGSTTTPATDKVHIDRKHLPP